MLSHKSIRIQQATPSSLLTLPSINQTSANTNYHLSPSSFGQNIHTNSTIAMAAFTSNPTSRRASTSSDKAGKQAVSMKKLWTSLKNAAVEHHKSVNAAYDAYYSQGRYVPRSGHASTEN